MPVYDFECEKCKEIYQNIIIKSDVDFECEKCNSICKKLIGSPDFKINGHSEANGYNHKPSISELGFEAYEREIMGQKKNKGYY